jgi:hypothetical protein
MHQKAKGKAWGCVKREQEIQIGDRSKEKKWRVIC